MPGGYEDSRAPLIEALKRDPEHFNYSNNIFKKGSAIEALKDYAQLRGELLAFAANPDANPVLEPPPEPPSIDGLSEQDAIQAQYNYNMLLKRWLGLEEAHKTKVNPATYWQIEEYLHPYKVAIDALSAIKGKRFMALTKRYDNQPKGGLLGKIMGSGSDE
jgi:hypothetical protein